MSKAPFFAGKIISPKKSIVYSYLLSGMGAWPRDVDILIPKYLSSCTFETFALKFPIL